MAINLVSYAIKSMENIKNKEIDIPKTIFNFMHLTSLVEKRFPIFIYRNGNVPIDFLGNLREELDINNDITDAILKKF